MNAASLCLALFAAGFISCLLVPPLAAPAEVSYQQYQDETGLPARAVSLHFTVFASGEEEARDALNEFEEALGKIMANLYVKKVLDKPCYVFIWPDEKEYVRRGHQYHLGDIESTLGFSIVGSPADPYRIFLYQSERYLEEVIPHELGHLVLEIILNPLRKYSIPLWLHEGFAQVHERGDYLQSLIKVKLAKQRGKMMPLVALVECRGYPSGPLDHQLLYLESEALVRFLLDRQTREGEFHDFCAEFLFWHKLPGEIIKQRFGGTFADLGAVQEKLLAWIGEKTEGVPIAPDNTFFQPRRRYDTACRKLREGQEQEQKGDQEKTRACYEAALRELLCLQAEDPLWNKNEVQKMIEDCRGKRSAAESALVVLPAGKRAEEVRARFSLERALGFSERDIREAFGEVSSGGKLNLEEILRRRVGSDPGLTYALYSNLGLAFVCRGGTVIWAGAFEPYDGEFMGVKIGDPRDEVENNLGFKLQKKGYRKDTVNLGSGKAELEFSKGDLSGISVYREYW